MYLGLNKDLRSGSFTQADYCLSDFTVTFFFNPVSLSPLSATQKHFFLTLSVFILAISETDLTYPFRSPLRHLFYLRSLRYGIVLGSSGSSEIEASSSWLPGGPGTALSV